MFLNEKQIERNIAWLLSNGSAPVKYLTHKHLLDTTAASQSLESLFHEVENCTQVQEIFRKQDKDGSWCTGGSWAHNPSYAVKGGIDPFTPKYVTTVWILPLLGEMGYSANDKRILKACRYVVSNGYFLDPLFSKPTNVIGRSKIDLSPCRFAQYMIALGAVNFVDDIRVEKGYEVLLCMQRDDGGWVFPKHAEQMGWTRSCLFSTYHATMALYCSRNPTHREALIRGAEFILWHLSTKKECNLQQFYYHGHSTVRELVMFSELGIGLRKKAVKTILKWLMTMYDAEEGCFRYTGKPISKYSRRVDGMDSRVAKYRLYHLIENDWFTYHMTKIAQGIFEQESLTSPKN